MTERVRLDFCVSKAETLAVADSKSAFTRNSDHSLNFPLLRFFAYFFRILAVVQFYQNSSQLLA
jgi:hypothetical protein